MKYHPVRAIRQSSNESDGLEECGSQHSRRMELIGSSVVLENQAREISTVKEQLNSVSTKTNTESVNSHFKSSTQSIIGGRKLLNIGELGRYTCLCDDQQRDSYWNGKIREEDGDVHFGRNTLHLTSACSGKVDLKLERPLFGMNLKMVIINSDRDDDINAFGKKKKINSRRYTIF